MTRGGRAFLIEDDVCNVARDLQTIDPSLRLRFNDQGKYVVYQVREDGEQLVGIYDELDQRIVERAREYTNPAYNLADELDRVDAEREHDRDREFTEQVGDLSERLAHAVREDLRRAVPGPVYIPPDISPPPRRR
jgi:hypothetical protein